MEIIARTERRRIYNDDEKAVVLAASFEPRVTVREVARRFGIASLVHNWRSAHRKAVIRPTQKGDGIGMTDRLKKSGFGATVGWVRRSA